MFLKIQKNGARHYLQIVESYWENGGPKQRVLHRLGRLDQLRESGELDSLLMSLQKYSEKLAVLGMHKKGELQTKRTLRIGPAMIFQKQWKELGIDKVIGILLQDRKFKFPVERSIFLTVLHRLIVSGSDRSAERWKEGYRIPGAGKIDLHHLYRAMAWLGSPAKHQNGATPFAARCIKDQIEEELFDRRRGLFSGLELVFFDTTSIYFEGEGGESLGAYGHSKDHRPDLKQMVVGVVLDNDGNPLCSEIWPGNVTDVKTLVPVVDRLRERFYVRGICVVADRGMISREVRAEIEKRGWKYILGARMRRWKEVRDEVLTRGGSYHEVVSSGEKGKSPLKVKEVRVEGKRYIVCVNEDQSSKDCHDREAIVEALRDALKQGDKSLVGNKGYRRYIKAEGKRFSVDEEKLEKESRYDGKWVLSTNTDLSAADAALKYKQLWRVESIFRSMKSLLETRPIYHKCDETIRGHVFCSFLALLLRKELEDRLEAKGWKLEWEDIIRDLDNLLEMEVEVSRKRYVIRSQVQGVAAKVFHACGVAIPPQLRQL